MGSVPSQPDTNTGHICSSQRDGQSNGYSTPGEGFTIVVAGRSDPQSYLRMDAYSAAAAFVAGKFDVQGDLFSAIRCFARQRHSAWRQLLFSALARVGRLGISIFESKQRSLQSIRFHYDRSNEFYSQFLDSRMVYSAAEFDDPDESLESAQGRKLERICRDLELHRNERFLDIGCGWGGLITQAAAQSEAEAYGCTLSEEQLRFTRELIERNGLQGKVTVDLCDYRDLQGTYDKLASVGMFEHVGRMRLSGYFRKAFALVKPGGLFLNRGVVRPQGSFDAPETLFVQRNVFPGGELVHLDDVIREGERAGFEATGLRNLRTHYALTCRAWVKNLQKNSNRSRKIAGEATYRTWLLYLAASAVGFEDGTISAAQVLFRKRLGATGHVA